MDTRDEVKTISTRATAKKEKDEVEMMTTRATAMVSKDKMGMMAARATAKMSGQGEMLTFDSQEGSARRDAMGRMF